MLSPWKESYDQPRQHIKKQRHYFAEKGLSCQSYGFSSSRVWMWELDCKESWAQKNGCFWTVVLEKTLESPLHHKEIKPVHPKGNQSWIFIGRTDAEAKTPVLWPPDSKNWLWKRPWCWERLKAGGEEDDRGWDSWMASPTQWTWVWVNSRSWWWTRKPVVLQSMGSQRDGHDWVTELMDLGVIKPTDVIGTRNWYISPPYPLFSLILFKFVLTGFFNHHKISLFFYFFGHPEGLAGSYFLNLGLKPRSQSKSTKSSSLDHQVIPIKSYFEEKLRQK